MSTLLHVQKSATHHSQLNECSNIQISTSPQTQASKISHKKRNIPLKQAKKYTKVFSKEYTPKHVVEYAWNLSLSLSLSHTQAYIYIYIYIYISYILRCVVVSMSVLHFRLSINPFFWTFLINQLVLMDQTWFYFYCCCVVCVQLKIIEQAEIICTYPRNLKISGRTNNSVEGTQINQFFDELGATRKL